jgi:hypothetical protein
MGIDCHGIRDLKIQNLDIREVFFLNITPNEDQFYFQAINKNASIEFKAKYISLCDPNIYMDGADDYFLSSKIHDGFLCPIASLHSPPHPVPLLIKPLRASRSSIGINQ